MRIVTPDGLTLQATVDEPEGTSRGGIVLCHPDPLQGGSMRAPFLDVVAERLATAGYRILRFDTRGTGASDGSFGGGVDEALDLDAAWEALDIAPRGLAGWSFGARLAMRHAAESAAPLVVFAPPLRDSPGRLPPLARPSGPVLAVVGDRDQFVDVDEVEAALGVTPVVLHGCDHFFIGRFAEMAADAARAFFDDQLPRRLTP